MSRYLIAMSILCALGCVRQPPPSSFPAREQQLEKPAVSYTGGSLWQASSAGLADDLKARRIGDTLTVVITEQTSASKSATTGTARGSSATASVPKFLGLEKTPIKGWVDLNNLVSAANETKFDGSGSTTRKDNLTATITARVVEVLPNGNLLIEGRRNIVVNNEDQMILLEGTVRPRDISTDNYIASTLIADARITYTGNGVISDRQSPGWLMNLVDVLWPF